MQLYLHFPCLHDRVSTKHWDDFTVNMDPHYLKADK
jgi:hypothetical protein